MKLNIKNVSLVFLLSFLNVIVWTPLLAMRNGSGMNCTAGSTASTVSTSEDGTASNASVPKDTVEVYLVRYTPELVAVVWCKDDNELQGTLPPVTVTDGQHTLIVQRTECHVL